MERAGLRKDLFEVVAANFLIGVAIIMQPHIVSKALYLRSEREARKVRAEEENVFGKHPGLRGGDAGHDTIHGDGGADTILGFAQRRFPNTGIAHPGVEVPL